MMVAGESLQTPASRFQKLRITSNLDNDMFAAQLYTNRPPSDLRCHVIKALTTSVETMIGVDSVARMARSISEVMKDIADVSDGSGVVSGRGVSANVSKVPSRSCAFIFALNARAFSITACSAVARTPNVSTYDCGKRILFDTAGNASRLTSFKPALSLPAPTAPATVAILATAHTPAAPVSAAPIKVTYPTQEKPKKYCHVHKTTKCTTEKFRSLKSAAALVMNEHKLPVCGALKTFSCDRCKNPFYNGHNKICPARQMKTDSPFARPLVPQEQRSTFPPYTKPTKVSLLPHHSHRFLNLCTQIYYNI
ncbi:unnamed protein product [Rhizopus stolonifer]